MICCLHQDGSSDINCVGKELVEMLLKLLQLMCSTMEINLVSLFCPSLAHELQINFWRP